MFKCFCFFYICVHSDEFMLINMYLQPMYAYTQTCLSAPDTKICACLELIKYKIYIKYIMLFSLLECLTHMSLSICIFQLFKLLHIRMLMYTYA